MANIVMKVPQKSGGEKVYKLEYTRRTLLEMEESGVIKQLDKGASQKALDELVYYACKKNHPNITKEEAMSIIDSVSSKDLGKFIEALGSLLEKSINAIEDKSEEGNAHWEVN